MTQTLVFRNDELAPVANFLQLLKLKNLASRGRTKLVHLLALKNNEYSEDRLEALDDYFDGQKVKSGHEDEAKKVAEQIESEYAVIDFTEYEGKLGSLYEALQEYPYEFDNREALIYDLLLDKFDEAFKKKEGN